jgi:hypothetical protein
MRTRVDFTFPWSTRESDFADLCAAIADFEPHLCGVL